MTPFNGFTILIAVMLILLLVTQGFSLYAQSAKHKPQTAQDTVNYVAGTIYIIAGVWITLKTYDALK
jgi:threonine/homoserine/homoserine lactone efflux protein